MVKGMEAGSLERRATWITSLHYGEGNVPVDAASLTTTGQKALTLTPKSGATTSNCEE